VSLEILDVNDNAPEFPFPSIVRELVESSGVGTAMTVDSATDRDTTEFGVSRYELVADDEQTASHFQLNTVCTTKFIRHSGRHGQHTVQYCKYRTMQENKS